MMRQTIAVRQATSRELEGEIAALRAENALLLRGLARAQASASEGVAELHGEVQRLQRELMRLRAALIIKQSQQALLQMRPVDLGAVAQAAARALICQTGCLAHDAHWLAQGRCRLHGQACELLPQPAAEPAEEGSLR
ncbi:YeaH/YhbH family protein [Ramlibacter sp. 2FC]|uniref:YeaH/YhbH family protein n=1 Tax=Ramlibacter sp. 2FC TaxID=2502188 RepID=UPI0010F759BA|nr:YeaH/YhbH family protein [Ramlibacter sp. 2FC]